MKPVDPRTVSPVWFGYRTLQALTIIARNSQKGLPTPVSQLLREMGLSRKSGNFAYALIDTLVRHGLVKRGRGFHTATLVATCSIELFHYRPQRKGK